MAETTKLKLPKISDNMTADVVRDFNALADAVDAKAGAAGGLATLGADGKVPAGQLAVDMSGLATKAELSAHNEGKASLTAYGHAKLSSATNSTAEDLAATPKAVKAAYDLANEAKQQANDGKTAVANAVTAKGVSASPTDTFATLAGKIGQISTGKKWAIGTAVSNNVISNNYRNAGATDDNLVVNGMYKITANNLNFKPKIIIIRQIVPPDVTWDAFAVSIYVNESTSSKYKTATVGIVRLDSNFLEGQKTYHYSGEYGDAYTNSSGFSMPVLKDNESYQWIAYE